MQIPSLQIFIISWACQHDNALLIANKLAGDGWSVNIIYSDPNPALALKGNWISTKRPNDLFWADKFKGCLENFNADLMLVIHADTLCDDWSLMVKKCFETMHTDLTIGVWAPLIDNTPFHANNTTVGKIAGTSLHIVCQTDGIIFCLRSSIVDRMRYVDYSKNIYGFGIDYIFITNAYSSGKLAVIDTSVVINHSFKRGYDSSIAISTMTKFLSENLTFTENALFIVLRSYWHSRYVSQT